MALYYTNEDVLRACERVVRELELDYDLKMEDRRIAATIPVSGVKYRVFIRCTKSTQVLHLYTFFPFDVENEEDALLMAKACRELNSIMVTGKYTYDLEKDVTLEFSHCFRDGISEEAIKRLLVGLLCGSLKDDGQRVIDLYKGVLPFDRFCKLIRE